MEKIAQKFNLHQKRFSTNTWVVILILVAIGAALWITLMINSTLEFNPQHWLSSDSHWLILISLSFFLMFVCATTPLPAEAITMANGIVFGPFLGTLITWISAMLSAGITFCYARRLLRKTQISLQEQDKYQKLNDWVDRYGVYGLMLARLIPIVPFFALNIGAALLPVSTRSYLLVTGVGILPHIMLICFFSGHVAGH